jgi:hypothetical protein
MAPAHLPEKKKETSIKIMNSINCTQMHFPEKLIFGKLVQVFPAFYENHM